MAVQRLTHSRLVEPLDSAGGALSRQARSSRIRHSVTDSLDSLASTDGSRDSDR